MARPPTITAESDVSRPRIAAATAGTTMIGQRDRLQPHHVGQKDAADAGQHAGNRPGPGVDAQAPERRSAPLISRSLASARIDRPSRLRLRKTTMPSVTSDAQAKRDRARCGDAHADHLKSDGVGRQTQAARPLAPNEFAEAENDECKTERRDRAHDRIAVRETRRDDASVEQRQRGRRRRRRRSSRPMRGRRNRRSAKPEARRARQARPARD